MSRSSYPASGTQVRTFLIADVRGYTQFTVAHGDEAAVRLAAKFAAICRNIVAAHEGEVIELRGDEALAVFSSTREALRAAVGLQARFTEESLADPSLPLRAGIGLDAGEAIAFEGGYRGAALNLAARLCSLAGAGEVLVTEAVQHLARRIDGVEYLERAEVSVKGFEEPVKILEIRSGNAAAVETSVAAEEAGSVDAPAVQHLPIGGFLGSLPATPLVSRDEELQRLLAPVDAVLRGEGRVVLLAGEPGVGKTRLAQELTLRLRNAGALIAAGSCFEARQTVPYYPFLDVVATLYGVASPGLRAQASRQWSALAHLLPEAGIPHTAGASEQEEQERLFRAVNGLVAALAEQAPVAILLDDLHWADRASLDLLQHLARHTRGHRVLIVGSYRDVEVGRQHPLETTLLELGRHGLIERVAVRRLDQNGTAALMEVAFGEEITEEFAHLVHQNTEGNPFFTQEVLRALVERGDVYREDGRWERLAVSEIQVPESVRAAIGQRLSHLTEEAQEILREASVLGQRFHFDALQVMSNRSEEEVESALEEAAAVGLVSDTGKDVYAFEHALVQQSLYAELSPRRRRRLHLAAAEALEERGERRRGPEQGSRAAELAWHFLQADDERALPYALLAGDEAEALYAHGEAEAQYRTALELARDPGDRPREAETLEKLATVLFATARFEEALGPADQAAGTYRSLDDSEGERRSVAILGRAYSFLARNDEGLARVNELIDRADPALVSRGLFELYSTRGSILFTSFRTRENYENTLVLRDLSRRLEDDRLVLRAAERHANALMTIGRVRESIAAYQEMMPLAEKLIAGPVLGAALHNAADASRVLGDLRAAIAYQERSLETCERIGDPSRVGFMHGWLGHFLTLLGRWDQARTHCQQGVKIFDSIGFSWSAVYPLLYLGDLDQMEGREEADERLERAMELAIQGGDMQAQSELVPPMTRRAILGGHPEDAVELVQGVIERWDEQSREIWGPASMPYLAWARLEAGNVREAQRVIEQSLAAPIMELPFNRVPGLRVLGMIAAQSGKYDQAGTAFEEALALARAMPWPFEEAMVLHQQGVMHASMGDAAAAEQRLREAAAIFQRLGARPYAARSEHALAGLS